MEQITAIHITSTSIRIASGGFNKFGKLKIQKTAYIADADRFFEDEQLVCLRDMVQAVSTVMKEEKILCKTLSICYDAEGIEVESGVQELAPQKEQMSFKAFLTKDLSEATGGRKEKKRKPEIQNGNIVRQQNWGDFTVRNKGGSVQTISTADYDLIVALTNEFTEKGFYVKSIEGVTTALLYLKHSYPFSYDNMSQLVINVDTDGMANVVTFTKNIPSKIEPRRLTSDSYESMAEGLAQICEGEVKAEQHHQPVVIIGGDGIRSYKAYEVVANHLVSKGYIVYDIYDFFAENGLREGVKIQVEGDGSPDRCGLFTACISLMFRKLDANPESLVVRSIRKSSIVKLQMIAQTVNILAGAMMVLSLILMGFRVVDVVTTRQQMVDTTVQTAALSSVTAKKAVASEKLTALGYKDDRIPNLVNFISEITPDDIHIISMDTDGTIPGIEVESILEATTDEEVDETPVIVAATAESIIVRGFATESHLPVDLYENCVASGVGDFELVGTKEVELPNGEVLYAFELALRTGGAT